MISLLCFLIPMENDSPKIKTKNFKIVIPPSKLKELKV